MIVGYIGNFIYENGDLKMINHPEGIIRPSSPQSQNSPEFVFDYFVKDYLGNVRVVITEENATLTDKWLATMEEVHAVIEENDFDNLPEFREDLPTGYPIDASVEFNERIARLAAENGTIIGPSKFLEVKAGERVFGGVSSFYKEDAPGTTYNNLGMFVEEMLIAIAASGVGVLPIQPDQLLNIASGGNSQLNNSLAQLLGTSFDTASTSTPHAYLVWTTYDNQFRVNLANSGAIRVLDPNSLERILTESINIERDGYLHVYVSNGSEAAVSFDNFLVQSIRGNVRQIHWLLGAGTWPYSHESRFFSGVNHYYPYGLSIAGLNQLPDDYLHGYQSKELMTGDFVSSSSSGLEMYDFHARLYDPQLGRWFAPDPAEQFHNPYLAMGNNPVGYVDPDGRFVFFVPHVNAGTGSFDIGFTIGVGIPGVKSAQLNLGHTFQQGGPGNSYASLSGTLGGVTGYVDYGTQTGSTAGVGFGFGPYMGGFNTNLTSVGVNWSQNYGFSANLSAWSISNGGWDFNPSVGMAPGFGWESAPESDPFMGAMVCEGCPPVGYVDIPEVNIVERYSASQRFAKWQRNRTEWSKWSTYRPNHYNPLNGYALNVNVEFSIGAQLGAGVSVLGGGISFSARPLYYELWEGNYSPSSSDPFSHNYIGKNGVRVGNEFTSPAARVFSEFNTSGDQNHVYGGNYGPVGTTNRGSYIPLIRANASFIIGVRLSIDLQKPN